MSSSSWPTDLSGRAALHRYAPSAAETITRLVGTIAAPPYWVALARWSCATAQELTPLPAPDGAEPLRPEVAARQWSSLPAADQTVLRFTEQFSVDVSALNESLRAEQWSVLDETPRQARGRFLAMAWVADQVPRVVAVLDALFAMNSPVEMIEQEWQVEDATALAHEFVKVVHNLDELDPVLSELVRLRGAHAHNCRLCKSLRSHAALEAGATSTELDAAGAPAAAQLTPIQRTALEVVDAVIWHPARISAALVEDVHARFTPEQAVELVLDVMRNAWNKTTVAAQLDEPHVADGLEVYRYHDDGTVEFGLAILR